MREILFKGKRKDNGEWVEGDLYHCPNASVNINTHKQGQPWLGYSVIPETVGEYSGMPDKFGNRIFEGDIIKITLPLSGYKPIIEKSEVYFDRGCFCVNWHGTRTRMDAFASHVTFEIIGNVFDNPELLKGSE